MMIFIITNPLAQFPSKGQRRLEEITPKSAGLRRWCQNFSLWAARI
jgi:hypothetical protein